MSIPHELQLKDCWDKAIYSYGTGYIFEMRAASARSKLTILQFMGVISPLLVGSVIISFGLSFKYIGYLFTLTGTISTLQLIFSVWALVSKWDDRLAYSLESSSTKYKIANHFESLAKDNGTDFDIEYRVLLKEDEVRGNSDYKQSISEKEKRKGMRSALRKYQRKCVACQKTPVSMKSSKCDVCGNF
jgi:mobilome CxxCx(11)CxxC protein